MSWFTRKRPKLNVRPEDSGSFERLLVVGLLMVCTIAAVAKIGTTVLARWNSVASQLDDSPEGSSGAAAAGTDAGASITED